LLKLVIPDILETAAAKIRKQLLFPDGTVDGHVAYQEEVCGLIVYELMRLGHAPRSILDIGCGLAVLPALLALRLDIRDVYLIDGDGSIELGAAEIERTGAIPRLREDTVAWADVRHGVAMVSANIPHASVTGYNSDPLDFPVDLVVSMRAWGHHFPIEQYGPCARWCLGSGGVIVVGAPRGMLSEDAFEFAGGVRVAELPTSSNKCDLSVFTRSEAQRWG
jgi:SAM-dependent methyltransferase